MWQTVGFQIGVRAAAGNHNGVLHAVDLPLPGGAQANEEGRAGGVSFAGPCA
jgi:hypothetical protein